MNTPLLIYLIGSIFGAIIVGCWACKQCHGDIVVSDLLWVLVMTAFGFGLSWATVITWLIIRYGDKVVIRRKKK